MSDTTAAGPIPAPEPGKPAASGTGAGSALAVLGELVGFLRRGDFGLALGIVTILVVLILPMPAVMLDFFLAVSITFAVLILMTALFIHTPLEFSAFPTILLIATMIRLALNMASTRLILTNGHEGTDAAGYVIEAFGNFVMQGNFVIGIIVFAILVIVNFVVITKGSGRIAEVAARFTLDAMPGKQMAIDADLSAGLINEDEARARRKKLEDESSFFGAMDGASKFVRGDAIAGLLITFINIIGGMIVGVGQNGLSMAEAGQTYTLLTIGDGLVSQIPALIVSTAAGLLVSKAGVDGAADKAFVQQLSGYPKALGMSSFVMGGMAMLPGIPLIPFLGLSVLAGGFAWHAVKNKKEKIETEAAVKQAETAEAAEPKEEPISETLHMDELRLELGYGLVPMINDPLGDSDKLTEQIKALRRQLASDMGFVMPSVRILDNMQLGANDYVIKVKEVEAGNGTLFPEQYMAMDPQGAQIELPGNHTKEPTFGLPATWIDANLRDEAVFKGYTVVDPVTVISTHLTEALKVHMSELLSYGEMQSLLDRLPDKSKKLLDDVVPAQVSASTVQRVLQSLLGERVSIRDLSTILEGIAEASGFTQAVQPLTEHVRTRLARQICASHVSPNGYLPLVTLSPKWEHEFAEAIVGEGDDRQLAMVPSRLQEFVKELRAAFETAGEAGEAPVLLTSPGIRYFVRQIIERFRPQTPVLSQNEVHPQAKLKTVGQV
ncbi:MAG TPA: flagellar biosynthesis protein FlhA [Rhizobiales bacterium]|nr:flagellar biosynthesis protein FlhA [bacterium BMS3Bbin10]HDO51221.1 flagellar biosynthesis protein FlhA [Hyphomicrobiales bacterium]